MLNAVLHYMYTKSCWLWNPDHKSIDGTKMFKERSKNVQKIFKKMFKKCPPKPFFILKCESNYSVFS